MDVCRTITGIDLDVRRTPGTTLNSPYGRGDLYASRRRGAFARDAVELGTIHQRQLKDRPVGPNGGPPLPIRGNPPFPDGNGRTGRILNILSLIQEGLLDAPTLYLSRHILNTRGDYYRLLGRVTSHQEWEPWLLYVLAAVEETSGWTTQKIRAVRALMDETIAYVRVAAPKVPLAVVEQIFTYPYCRIANLVERGIAGREAVSKYLEALVGGCPAGREDWARQGLLAPEIPGRAFRRRARLRAVSSGGGARADEADGKGRPVMS